MSQIKMSFKSLWVTGAVFCIALNSTYASDSYAPTLEEAYYTAELVEVVVVDKFGQEIGPLYTVQGGSSLEPANSPTEMTVDEIINIGRKVWEIIESNKPVVNVQMITANALPAGSQHWTELTNWGVPQVLRFKAKYGNLMGLTVAEATFRVQFTPGGQYHGKGQYLNNVAVVPENIDVLWGYTFEANVQVGQTLNRGTSENPLAAMELSVNWRISTVMKDTQRSAGFFLQGDGKALQLNQK